MQPKTSDILPKFCRNFAEILPIGRRVAEGSGVRGVGVHGVDGVLRRGRGLRAVEPRHRPRLWLGLGRLGLGVGVSKIGRISKFL